MPRYLFNKAHLKKLIEQSPKDANVIGIYVHHVKKGNVLAPRVEAKAIKFDTTTGDHTAVESAAAVGTPGCPNPPGCTEVITATIEL